MPTLKISVTYFLTACFFCQTVLADKAIPFSRKAFQIYKTAVEMRTVEGSNLVPKLARYLESEFVKGGFPEKDIHVLEIGSSAALVVRYRGDGSLAEMPISISAHMDVVDAFIKDWDRDPFKLVEENGYFYGRGTSDNKLGITAVTAAFLRLKSEGWVPGRDLIIAFSGDEETSMSTTKALVNEYRHLTDSEFVLNADAGGATIPESGGIPSNYDMQAAEKTYVTWELTARNPGGHSSQPRQDNAIYDLASALIKIQNYQFPVRYNELNLQYFERIGKLVKGKVGIAMQRFASDPEDSGAINVLSAIPPLSIMLKTTCVATTLSGGHAENALPQSATATVNCRIFPGVGVESILKQLKEAIGNPKIEFTMLDEPTESPASPIRNDVLEALQTAINIKYPGLEIIPYMSPYGSDGMHFRAAGIHSYGVSGLYEKASDSFAHGLNERVLIETFYDNLTHWYVLLKTISAKQ